MMTVITIVALIAALFLAYKVLESIIKVIVWAVMLVLGYWLAAPLMGWPLLSDLVSLAWLDIERFAPGEWLDSLRDLLRAGLD